MYQRALALIAALLAAHCAWSVMSAEDISAPNVVLAKIAAIAPARLVVCGSPCKAMRLKRPLAKRLNIQ